MTQLFDRKCTVFVGDVTDNFQLVNALEITGLHVQFHVEKTLTKEPNKADILIHNLNVNSRAKLQVKGSRVVVQAGYAGTEAIIFVGDVRTVDHGRDGPDWVSKIQCGDGERAYLHKRINESFRPGVSVGQVVQTLTKALGIDSGNLKQFDETSQFVNGFSMVGKASAELDKVLTAKGWSWSIQDGRLQILRPGAATTDSVIELSPDSGLVGVPVHGTPEKNKQKPVLKVKSLLQPGLRPGGRVSIKSAGQNGLFLIQKVSHRGDTEAGEWYSDIEAVQL